MTNTTSDSCRTDTRAELGADKATKIVATRDAKPANGALLTGACTGGLLNSVMAASLFVANRMLNLEPYAIERDAACVGLFFVCSFVPLIRFVKRPAQMFTAGLSGWMLFVAGYTLAGFYFQNLFNAIQPPFELLIEGCVLYGIAAVAVWDVHMILDARRNMSCRAAVAANRMDGSL